MRAFRFIVAFALLSGLSPVASLCAETLGLDPRLDVVVAAYRQDGAQKALPQFERLAREYRKAGRTREEAAAIHYVGECHWRLGNYSDAHRNLDLALTLERSSNERASEGRTLNVLGLLAWDEGNYDQAIAHFKSAGSVARQLGDRKLEGASLNNLSLVYDELGDYDTSLKQYAQVLELYRSVDFTRGVGDTLGNIGGVHLLLGHYREALSHYQQALKISEQLNSTASMSQDHGNLALCLLGLGEVADALKHFDQAIALAQQAGMRQDQAYWLRQKGNGLIRQGQYDRGLAAHRAAIGVYEQVGAKPELAEALHDAGRLHLLLGDPDSAERYFNRALALARKSGLSRGITQNLVALGDLQFRRKALDSARSYYQQAQQRATETGEQQLQAQSLLRLSQVDRERTQLVAATTSASRALALARDLGARPLEAEALLAMGELQRRQGKLPDALQSFSSAEAALKLSLDPDLLWRIDYGRAKTLEARGATQDAIDSLLAAVTVIESVRNRLQEPRFRAGFVDDKYDVYVDLVRLQLQLGRTADAFSTAERLRARSFAEQLGGRSSLPLTDEDRRREAQMLDRIRQLQRALADADTSGQPVYPQRAPEPLLAGTAAGRAGVSGLPRRSCRLASRATPSRSTSNASNVQRRLREDEALIEFVVGSASVMTFVVTRAAVTARTTPLRLADLNARIALLRDLAQRPGDDRWLKPAARLSADLITPLLADNHLNGIRRLYVVPHGVLNYLPFAVLPIDTAPAGSLLIDRYAVTYLPAAATLLQSPDVQSTPRSLLAMAPARSRLRYAPEEVRSIDAMFAPNSRLLLGVSATESQFKRLAGSYSMLHLATHGSFNKVNPLLSGIELEADADNDGLLQVHEVLGLRLQANLVTLSACETALGSGYFAELPAGDDFVGMTRAFLAAGSGSVVATLWDVDDRASNRLMKQFYGRLKQSVDSESTADSLTSAQRELHQSKALGHPYYWAPFVVVGATTRSGSRAELAAGR